MHKILTVVILLMTVISLPGCKKNGAPAPTPNTQKETQTPTENQPIGETKPSKRVDVLGNEITSGYADGTFQKAESGMLYVDCNGEERTFRLSARAEKEISVLEIGEGQRIIVNFGTNGDGVEEAESIEKIISEDPSAIAMQ